MTITSDKPEMIFRDDKGKYPRYSIGVSSKDKEGEWIKGYIPCKFKKDVEVENMTKILIKNAFYTVNKGEKYNFVSVMITDFEVVDEGKPSSDDFMDIPSVIEEELPFK